MDGNLGELDLGSEVPGSKKPIRQLICCHMPMLDKKVLYTLHASTLRGLKTLLRQTREIPKAFARLIRNHPRNEFRGCGSCRTFYASGDVQCDVSERNYARTVCLMIGVMVRFSRDRYLIYVASPQRIMVSSNFYTRMQHYTHLLILDKDP